MDLLTGDPIDNSSPVVPLKADSEGLQHDLEKLQAAHDGLLHKLAEKDYFCEKLHGQLDRMVEDNNDLRERLETVQQENENLVKKLREHEATVDELRDNEAKNQKLKQLAVKLKKELAETKQELDRKSGTSSQELKDQIQTLEKENERLSNLCQSSIRNFQNLQSDFDKLQDEFDSLTETKKRSDVDLKQTLQELNRLRISAAEIKYEKENLAKKISILKEDAEINFNKRKELESKIIVLQTELNEERKKTSVCVGLERTVAELRSQLDVKTSEVVELGSVVERNKAIEEECMKIKQIAQELEDQMKKLKEENEEIKEQNFNLTRKLETNNTTHDDDRIRVVELMEENRCLRLKEEKLKESQSKFHTEYGNRIRILRDQLKEMENSLSFKEKEFEQYKSKVVRVLQEKENDSSTNQTLLSKIEELEHSIVALTTEKELVQKQLDESKSDHQQLLNETLKKKKSLIEKITNLQREIETLTVNNDQMKDLCRELQCQMVSQRNEYEEKLTTIETECNQLREGNNNLKQQIGKLEAESSSFKTIGKTTSNRAHYDSSTLETSACRRDEIRSCDDSESLFSTSLTPVMKRLSCSSGSESGMNHGNVLDEILNPKHENLDSGVDQMQNIVQETETHNLLLTEQNRVLKEEIRRLERSIQRMAVAKNLEYLKNLIVKFVSLNPGSSEKQQLVPVLKTLLKLDANEEKLLMSKATEDGHGHNASWSFLWS